MTRSRCAIAALAASMGLLAACSSGRSDSSTASPTTAGATTSTTVGRVASGEPLARYGDYESTSYDDPSHWICRPDIDDDVCDGDLDATRIDADGGRTVEPFVRADDPPIDCFYVYPTFSSDPTQFSDWEAEEEGVVTVAQAARLQSECRLFAPVYRQLTNAGLAALVGAGPQPPRGDGGDPYGDVLDAFRTYMARDNGGRGVVLIGHSQGTAMLKLLIQNEIDPNPDVRDLLVGAYLAGGTVEVPSGKTTGGDFQQVPICSADGEPGCALTWGSFRSTVAPAPRPTDPEAEAVRACVNPAAVEGGDAELDPYFPSRGKWTEPAGERLTTPFVRLPGLLSGRCVENGPASYLEVTVHGDPDGGRVDDIPGDSPGNGLHLVDVTVAMGDIVDSVAAQAATYLRG